MACNVTTFILLLSFAVLLVNGANRIDVKKRMAEGLEEWRTKRASIHEPGPDPQQALRLTQGEGLQPTATMHTKNGHTKTKFKETFHGIEVEGETLVAEYNRNGQLTGEVHGQLVEDLEDDLPITTPEISIQEALNIAVKLEGDDPQLVQFNPDKNSKLAIHVENTGDPDKVTPVLVWQLNYFLLTDDEISRPFYKIDALNGRIVQHWQGIDTFPSESTSLSNNAPLELRSKRKYKRTKSNLWNRVNEETHHSEIIPEVYKGDCRKGYTKIGGVAGTVKGGIKVFGRDFPLFEVKKQNGICIMENEYVGVADIRDFPNITWNFEDTEPHEFDCIKGNHDEVNGGYSPLNDAFYYSNVVYDMYSQWFNITPLENMPIAAVVHFDMENAFWTGQHIVLGDGGSWFHPLTSLDIVAHELAHGFTEHHSGLIYSDESGGMNEAYSDITGEAAEYFLSRNDWLVGGTVMKNEDALRYMSEPTRDKHSISSDYSYCPGINVHLSSGIFNRAFYLLSNQPGWNVQKAFEVFTTANILYWTPSSSFAQGACGVVRATADLGYDVHQAAESFRIVGVEPCKDIRGLRSMLGLGGKAGTNVTFLWMVEEGFSNVHIHTYSFNYWNQPELDLIVYSREYTFKSSTVNSSLEEVFIPEPAIGPHHIVLHGKTDFTSATVSVLSNTYMLAEDIAFNVTDLEQFVVEVSRDDLSPYSTLSLQITPKNTSDIDYGYILIRYGVPVNMTNWDFDQYSRPRYNVNWDFIFGELLICKPKAGTYYIYVIGQWGESADVDLTVSKAHFLEQLHEEGLPESNDVQAKKCW